MNFISLTKVLIPFLASIETWGESRNFNVFYLTHQVVDTVSCIDWYLRRITRFPCILSLSLQGAYSLSNIDRYLRLISRLSCILFLSKGLMPFLALIATWGESLYIRSFYLSAKGWSSFLVLIFLWTYLTISLPRTPLTTMKIELKSSRMDLERCR